MYVHASCIRNILVLKDRSNPLGYGCHNLLMGSLVSIDSQIRVENSLPMYVLYVYLITDAYVCIVKHKTVTVNFSKLTFRRCQ